jgi:hypothetical protein
VVIVIVVGITRAPMVVVVVMMMMIASVTAVVSRSIVAVACTTDCLSRACLLEKTTGVQEIIGEGVRGIPNGVLYSNLHNKN